MSVAGLGPAIPALGVRGHAWINMEVVVRDGCNCISGAVNKVPDSSRISCRARMKTACDDFWFSRESC